MRIVAASDGTALSSIAHRLLATTRWPPGSVVRLVASQASSGDSDRSHGDAAATADATAGGTAALARLEGLAPHLRRAGLDVELVASRGSVASALIQSVRETSADLLVVGGDVARAHGALMKPLELELLERAPCPVLAVLVPAVTRILVAVDRSSVGRAITRILGRWHAFVGTPIEVVSVVEPSSSAFVTPWAEPIDIDRMLERNRRIAHVAAADLVRHGWDAVPSARPALSAGEVVAAADERGADLIVISAHGGVQPGQAHLGALAREVLERTHGSVLVVAERRSARRAGSVANGLRTGGRDGLADALTRS